MKVIVSGDIELLSVETHTDSVFSCPIICYLYIPCPGADSVIGAHAAGANTNRLGICLYGKRKT